MKAWEMGRSPFATVALAVLMCMAPVVRASDVGGGRREKIEILNPQRSEKRCGFFLHKIKSAVSFIFKFPRKGVWWFRAASMSAGFLLLSVVWRALRSLREPIVFETPEVTVSEAVRHSSIPAVLIFAIVLRIGAEVESATREYLEKIATEKKRKEALRAQFDGPVDPEGIQDLYDVFYGSRGRRSLA